MESQEITYNSPMYLQLREVIRTKIEDGEYQPGMAIPSENELAETYGINRMTVRSAIDTLIREGMLLSVQGKGVFVVGKKHERNLDILEGFTQIMRSKNSEPKFKILQNNEREAGKLFARLFGINPEDPIYYIKRTCYDNKEPVSIEELFIPAYLVPKFKGIDLTVFSIYEIYAFYQINLVKAVQTLDIARLNQRDAKILDEECDAPVLLFECISYDDRDRVIEFSRSYTRGGKSDYSVNFTL
ncbi:GntR family transcriptional regulator [Proteiniclasticum sp. BAD-10]|uniref:GntR family transcriptional regulator n=1 Tax=Proteiniclasticum sediminis TaxID=2804028 RepID=A0A941CQX7_9CLOT|nr:GntR family transcriptional regulator [Proteiniclasticum sediminis]MBR0577057.1 GntR family transcriptional regulator [Proteiniclasticum sediminis]